MIVPRVPSWDNPILTKELRTRMRGARAFWILFAYTGTLAVFLFFVYLTWWRTQQSYSAYGGYGGSAAFTVGRTFYGVLFSVQAVLVGLITPSLTAGGVSIEKEQRTFELLTASLLPRRAIVNGKLAAAVLFVALLLTASLPLVSLCFLLGGVSPGEVGAAYVLLLVCAFLYGAVGIACSSVARSTSSATASAFGAVLLLFCATLPLSLVASATYYAGGNSLRGTSIGLSALNPIGAVTAGTAQERYFGLPVPAWLTGIVLNGLLGVIFTLSAAHRLEFPRSDRSGLLRLLTAVYVALMAFCLYGMFLPGTIGSLMTTIFGSSFSPSSHFGLGQAGVITIGAPVFWAAIFCTGDGLPTVGGVWSLLDPRRLRRGEAPSGLLFSLLLAVLCGGILYAGARFGPSGARFAAAGGAETVGAYAALLVSATWGLGALGLLFSALFKNRWSALALTGSIAVLLFALPPLSVFGRDTSSGWHPSLWDNVVYLSPILGANELIGPQTQAFRWGTMVDPRTLLGGSTPFYQITPWVYTVLGGVFFAAAGAVDSRRRSRERMPPPIVPVDSLPAKEG